MSGSDIRDILELGKPTEKDKQAKRPKQAIEKRPEGISRELYSLIGGPPPASLLQPTYKAKFSAKKKAVPWITSTFSNPARSDDLQLSHWIKATEADQPGYPFCRIDTPPDMIHYTNEEYEEHLRDHSWSKQETDYLMGLCDKYDLKFQVIADRFEFDAQRPRSIEDIKERFYDVQTILHQLRGEPFYHNFNKEHELKRKHARRMLYTRTKEEKEEEDYVLAQVQRIDHQRSKLAKEREMVQTLLEQDEKRQQALTPLTKKGKSKKDVAPKEKGKRKRKQDNKDDVSVDPKTRMPPGVYVQSERLALVKPHLQTKSFKILNELGIGIRPVMPTAAIGERFDALVHSVTTLLELKKVVDKMEIEHRISQKRQRVQDTVAHSQ
ncbi:hypothetical protein BC940DRAFT_290382 [Gongronella butleri]|nr:hypothetical protein BC940DRAFT_290382 [Gongronella butleri]